MATNAVERAEGNASAVLHDRVRSSLTVFHLHSRKGRESGGECFPHPRAIHFRAKLSRGGIAIKRSVSLAASSSPSPRYLRNHSRATSLLDDLHSPSSFNSPVPPIRATAPSPPCRIQMSLFSGPLRSPFTQAVRGYEERQRARKRLRGWSGEDGRIGRGSARAGLDKSPVDRYACPNERAGALEPVTRRTATVYDKIA